MKSLLIWISLISFICLSGCEKVDEIAPLEKIVKRHGLHQSDVTYIYMYSGARDYQVAMLNNLRHCANQRLKYLAVSTFDAETEKAFLSLLSSEIESCKIVFYGTAEAVAEARSYFPNGIFLSGSLDANSNIKLVYDASEAQRKLSQQ